MDFYYDDTENLAVTKSDQALTKSGSGSGSWLDPLTLARLRLSPPSPPSAFLGPAFDACASATSDVDPTLLRLTRSGGLRFSSPSAAADSPISLAEARRLLHMKPSVLSPIENLKQSPANYKARPLRVVDVEEDVLVMDGILVSDSRANIKRNNSAEFSSPANSSGGRGGFSKTEMCWSWKELGQCRYGSKCQFAHWKEELRSDPRGPRSWKQKNEVVRSVSSTKSTPSSGSSSAYGSKYYRYISLPSPNTPDPDLPTRTSLTKLAETAAVSTINTESKLETAAPTVNTESKPEPTAPIAIPVPSTPLSSSSTFNWPPTVNTESKPEPTAPIAIPVPLTPLSSSSTFNWPPSEEEEELIMRVLYGPSSKRRLPVFEEICSQ